MSDLRLYSNGSSDDRDLARALRAEYAAPSHDAYWTELETRIMSRITELELGWWNELAHWMRPAVAAAAVALLGAGLALFRERQAEARSAYASILAPAPVPVETAVRPSLQGNREATLRYIISR